MAIADLVDWISENSGPSIIWYVKRLSANDTGATGAHQAGPYFPKQTVFNLFPSLRIANAENPRVQFDVRIDSHKQVLTATAIWYNNLTRNETRITNFGGAGSPLLDPDSTNIAVFAFHQLPGNDATTCHIWVCDNALQEDLLEEHIGPVEPGSGIVWTVDLNADPAPVRRNSTCRLEPADIPQQWLTDFPSGKTIVERAIESCNHHNAQIDERLLLRRKCEFEIFQSLEEAIELPVIANGYGGSIAKFLAHAQSVLQRRKARSGRSLELHVKAILMEENLRVGTDFDHQCETEMGKTPDFLFPSQAAYLDAEFSDSKLRMLAVKTTCKDRWRQVIDEAERIGTKHLLTLQEGVSVAQFKQMSEANIKLVVPEAVKIKYPEAIRAHLQNLESFIADIRSLSYPL